MAVILSTELGEHVTAHSLWPQLAREETTQAQHSAIDLPWNQQGSRQAAALVADVCSSVSAVRPPLISADALVGSAVDWLTADTSGTSGQHAGKQFVSPEVVEVLRDRIAQLRRLDDSQGGPLILSWVIQDLRWAAMLVQNGSYDASTGLSLHGILAELAQLAGWLASDQGQAGLGQRLLLIGLHAAHTAGDAALGANIVSCLSYQAMWAGNQQGALRLVRLARKGAGKLQRGRVPALLATRQARAHALLRDDTACAKALDEAAAAYDGGAGSEDPSWAYWVTGAVLAADAGRAWLELNRPDLAAENLMRGLELFGEAQPRNRMLHNASLAEARLALGDLDGAVLAAHDALNLAEQLISGRAYVRLRVMQAGFAAIDSPLSREVVGRTKGALEQ
ncbi:hypothetical protein [Streptacidiphilus sp. PB12-B1b]|uniref:hypothetical protein n=1 Tax=Streptacidiphilus sp. PB12-B1b TaxID=2705012 RepID=UPI001CDC7CBC|nr:hypothetical protein [Streptacidiphilus sp. PB12-B1b]